jgi:hypothetical protein
MGVLGFTHFFQEIEEGGGCPTITFGALTDSVVIPGSYPGGTSLISGGVGPYTITNVTGLPVAMVAEILDDSGTYYIYIYDEGSDNSNYGFHDVVITVEDINSCPGTANFELTLGAAFILESQPNIPAGAALVGTIPVSGIGNMMGTNVRLEFVQHSVTRNNLANVGYFITYGPDDEVCFAPYDSNFPLSGNNIIVARFTRTAVGTIQASSAPYNGIFEDFSDPLPEIGIGASLSGFDNGDDPNVDWHIWMNGAGSATGTLDNTLLAFIPMQ